MYISPYTQNNCNKSEVQMENMRNMCDLLSTLTVGKEFITINIEMKSD